MLANLCFLNSADNQIIKDKAPLKYKELLPTDRLEEILESHFCPTDSFDLDYEIFLKKRSEIIVNYINELII